MRRVVTRGLAGLALAATLAACATTAATVGAGAPPTRICGTTLADTAAGVVVLAAYAPGAHTVSPTLPVGGRVVLRFVRGCGQGVEVTTAPGPRPVSPGSISIVRRAAYFNHGLRHPGGSTIAMLIEGRSPGVVVLRIHRFDGPSSALVVMVGRVGVLRHAHGV
jgi:hypothetical protein